MPKDYTYKEDGKIHTRWTELKRCTPNQIERVIGERLGVREPYKNPYMDIGQIRHDEFYQESKLTGYLPEVFKAEYEDYISGYETEFDS